MGFRRIWPDDVELLLNSGESILEIAKRLEVKPISISRTILRMAKTQDDDHLRALAGRISREIHMALPIKYCSCGKEVGRRDPESDSKSGRCYSCVMYERWRDPVMRAKYAESAARVSQTRPRFADGRYTG